MIKILATLAVAVLTSVTVLAAPAVPGTLASYIALGSTGATIGTTLFSDFKLELNQTGATQIPTSILVNPIDLLGAPALDFTVARSALANELFELKLSYKVTDLSIEGVGVSLDTFSATGDGAVTATLDLTGPNPQPATLIAFATSGASTPVESTNFPSVAQVLARTDIVVDGGGGGTSSVRVVRNQFSVAAIPEPGTLLFGLGIFGVCATRRFRQRI